MSCLKIYIGSTVKCLYKSLINHKSIVEWFRTVRYVDYPTARKDLRTYRLVSFVPKSLSLKNLFSLLFIIIV